MTLSKSRKALTSDNKIFKLRLLWSLGLRDGFRRGISADNPFGFMNTETLSVIDKGDIFQWIMQIHRFLNDFYKDPTIRTQYKQYFEKIEEKLRRDSIRFILHIRRCRPER